MSLQSSGSAERLVWALVTLHIEPSSVQLVMSPETCKAIASHSGKEWTLIALVEPISIYFHTLLLVERHLVRWATPVFVKHILTQKPPLATITRHWL